MIRAILCFLGFHNWKNLPSIRVENKPNDASVGVLFICPDCHKHVFYITKHIEQGAADE